MLEIGGGVGELHLELLRAGASHATNLELVDAYDPEARRLAREAGLADRIDRRVVDIAAEPDAVEPADVVVLHRVVCCYPDVGTLLGAATDHARHLLVYSHPPRSAWTRAWFTVENAMQAALGRSYRAFTHPPREMLATVQRHGMEPVDLHRGLAWHVVACERRTD